MENLSSNQIDTLENEIYQGAKIVFSLLNKIDSENKAHDFLVVMRTKKMMLDEKMKLEDEQKSESLEIFFNIVFSENMLRDLMLIDFAQNSWFEYEPKKISAYILSVVDFEALQCLENLDLLNWLVDFITIIGMDGLEINKFLGLEG